MDYQQESKMLMDIMRHQAGDVESILIEGGPIIMWQFKNRPYEKIFVNSVPIERASEADMKAVQKYLGIKTDYTDPAQNPAIPSDLFQPEPDETEKKPDEIDYTDPNQNPAIPIND